MRRLESGSVGDLPHRRVVNSAYFSPRTGSKILTTAQDNRIRVWDSIFGNLESPSREIVHSHDFNRHLTAFRAEWDPKVNNLLLVYLFMFLLYLLPDPQKSEPSPIPSCRIHQSLLLLSVAI